MYMQFQFGWIADPLYFGDYPAVMRNSQPKLPKFKDSEKKLLAGSTDFLAVNYYTSHFVAAVPAGAPKSQVQPGSGSLRRVHSNHCPMQHIARRMLPAGESKLANMAVLCSCCCMVVWRHASNGCSFSWLCVDPQHLLATCWCCSCMRRPCRMPQATTLAQRQMCSGSSPPPMACSHCWHGSASAISGLSCGLQRMAWLWLERPT